MSIFSPLEMNSFENRGANKIMYSIESKLNTKNIQTGTEIAMYNVDKTLYIYTYKTYSVARKTEEIRRTWQFHRALKGMEALEKGSLRSLI